MGGAVYHQSGRSGKPFSDSTLMASFQCPNQPKRIFENRQDAKSAKAAKLSLIHI
jgi:hypothetical protein